MQKFFSDVAATIDVITSGRPCYSAFASNSFVVTVSSGTRNLKLLIQRVDVPRNASGGADMLKGLQACFNPVKGDSGNRVFVLLTEGIDRSPPNAATLDSIMKRAGIILVTVGIGSSVNQPYLRGVASAPSLFVPSFSARLPDDLVETVDKTCEMSMDKTCAVAYKGCDGSFPEKPELPTIFLKRN